MKRFITLLVTATILVTPSTAAAQSDLLDFMAIGKPKPETILAPINPPLVVQPKKAEPVVYIVQDGDSLSKIGTAHNVEWQRLWAKNTTLKHPDVIHVGDKLTIPEPSESLSRALPAVVALPTKTPGVAPLRSYAGGNTYDAGYCTWYVKNRRGSSLPNGLGNANTWYRRAASAGMSVGSTPKVGAVGATTAGGLGHVVYIESVNRDGTVTVSEMNYKGWGVQSTRTTKASEFLYIY